MPPFNKELVMKTLKTYVLVPLDSTSISNGEKSPFYDARQLQFIRNLPKDTGGDPSLKDFAASASETVVLLFTEVIEKRLSTLEL